MISFHGDDAIKQKYLARVRAHAAADEIVKGVYWQGGKGCAVGCTIHSENHAAYQEELGLPEWLARLEDTLFESLPNDLAKTFPERFLIAIPVGKDLAHVRWRFSLYLLEENTLLIESLQIDCGVKTKVLAAIGYASEVNRNAIASGVWDAAAASMARVAARAAEWSVVRAKESATWDAEWSARVAVWSSWHAAEAAALAAESAARAARSSPAGEQSSHAGRAAYVRYSEKLLELLAD